MKALLQRVSSASVRVEQELLGSIRKGLVILLGIYSEDDSSSLHLSKMDESFIVDEKGANAYLNIKKIISIAKLSKVDAIHPGYGFLSENKRFAEIIEEHNIKFIGPHSSHIKIMGNKIDAKKIMDENKIKHVLDAYLCMSLDCSK